MSALLAFSAANAKKSVKQLDLTPKKLLTALWLFVKAAETAGKFKKTKIPGSA